LPITLGHALNHFSEEVRFGDFLRERGRDGEQGTGSNEQATHIGSPVLAVDTFGQPRPECERIGRPRRTKWRWCFG
jgi:hypothetical protein